MVATTTLGRIRFRTPLRRPGRRAQVDRPVTLAPPLPLLHLRRVEDPAMSIETIDVLPPVDGGQPGNPDIETFITRSYWRQPNIFTGLIGAVAGYALGH